MHVQVMCWAMSCRWSLATIGRNSALLVCIMAYR